MLDELERRADAVGERDPVGRGHFEHVQHELADRIGRQRAVVDEVVEGRVGGLNLVAPVGLDQARRTARAAGSRSRTVDLERAHERVLRLAAVDAVEVGVEHVEQREAVALDLVAELVDEPGEAVDRHQMPGGLAAQHARRDWEVLLRRKRQDGVLAW